MMMELLALAVSIFSLFLSFFSYMESRKSNNKADKSNDIACESKDISREALRLEQDRAEKKRQESEDTEQALIDAALSAVESSFVSDYRKCSAEELSRPKSVVVRHSIKTMIAKLNAIAGSGSTKGHLGIRRIGDHLSSLDEKSRTPRELNNLRDDIENQIKRIFNESTTQ